MLRVSSLRVHREYIGATTGIGICYNEMEAGVVVIEGFKAFSLQVTRRWICTKLWGLHYNVNLGSSAATPFRIPRKARNVVLRDITYCLLAILQL